MSQLSGFLYRKMARTVGIPLLRLFRKEPQTQTKLNLILTPPVTIIKFISLYRVQKKITQYTPHISCVPQNAY